MMKNKVEIGSDNVFKDLGYANSEERLAKSELARKINGILKKKKWTQGKAAKIMGIPQPKISLISKGVVSGFSLGRLIVILEMVVVSQQKIF
ncbi:MAG: XRE family transcriptional regulator [Gammaproteobacteria bacterium]|nr:XRE family transcriptional regulator [Gammaproteobacteria bacterium]